MCVYTYITHIHMSHEIQPKMGPDEGWTSPGCRRPRLRGVVEGAGEDFVTVGVEVQ